MNKPSKIRVLISDRQPIFRMGLSQLLSNEPGIAVIGEAEDSQQVLRLADERKPSIVLLDSLMIELQDSDILQELQLKHKNLRVILMTPSERDDSGLALRKNAAGIIAKQAPFDMLLQCIHKVESGEPWVSLAPPLPARSLAPPPASLHLTKDTPLSLRERQVVSLVSQGFRNKEIADRMFISEQTVKNHLHNIFDKLGVSDRLELALYAIHKNLQVLE